MRIGNDHNFMLNDIPLLESAFQLAHIELLVCVLTEKTCSFNRIWKSPSKVGGNQWHFWPFKIIWDVAKPRFNIHTRFIFAARKREQITFTQKFFQLCDQDLFFSELKGSLRACRGFVKAIKAGYKGSDKISHREENIWKSFSREEETQLCGFRYD